MIKGLGQQTASVRYNIITSVLDVLLLFVLLPRWGMMGYFISFLITHAINFFLSFRRLSKIAKVSIHFEAPLTIAIAGAGAILAGSYVENIFVKIITYCLVLGCLMYLLGIVTREDIRWLRTLLKGRNNT